MKAPLHILGSLGSLDYYLQLSPCIENILGATLLIRSKEKVEEGGHWQHPPRQSDACIDECICHLAGTGVQTPRAQGHRQSP